MSNEQMTDEAAIAALDEAIRITDRSTKWMNNFKAARHYLASRLRSAAEPVAWDVLDQSSELVAGRIDEDAADDLVENFPGCRKSPLYASPPPASPGKQAVRVDEAMTLLRLVDERFGPRRDDYLFSQRSVIDKVRAAIAAHDAARPAAEGTA